MSRQSSLLRLSYDTLLAFRLLQVPLDGSVAVAHHSLFRTA